MNGKKNSNAIYRYARTSVYYADNTVKKDSDSYITNPIKTVNNNAFKLFTNNLEYYKTKYQHKHYDSANEPYKIRFNKAQTNAYIVWDNIRLADVSSSDKENILRTVLLALDVMSERAIKLTCDNVRCFILSQYPKFYFNGIDLAKVIRDYKKQHEIKHRTDSECLVFRPKKPSISIGAKRLGTVVK